MDFRSYWQVKGKSLQSEVVMSDLKKAFFEEASRRFQMKTLEEKDKDTVYADLGRRYVKTFLDSPDVQEKYTLEETRIHQSVLHCYHAGIIVALYALTEEDFVPSEKTFAVLTNMDTVFFSELMFARWNIKKRYKDYKTDEMAEAVFKVIRHLVGEGGKSLSDRKTLEDALYLVYLAALDTDLERLSDPLMDLSGIE